MSVDLTDFPQCVFCCNVSTPFLRPHTWFRQWVVPSWSCRRMDCLGDYTTAAYMGRTGDTAGQRETSYDLRTMNTTVNKRAGMRPNTEQRKQKSREEKCHNNSSHHNNITNNKTLNLSGATALYTMLHCEKHTATHANLTNG